MVFIVLTEMKYRNINANSDLKIQTGEAGGQWRTEWGNGGNRVGWVGGGGQTPY